MRARDDIVDYLHVEAVARNVVAEELHKRTALGEPDGLERCHPEGDEDDDDDDNAAKERRDEDAIVERENGQLGEAEGEGVQDGDEVVALATDQPSLGVFERWHHALMTTLTILK